MPYTKSQRARLRGQYQQALALHQATSSKAKSTVLEIVVCQWLIERNRETLAAIWSLLGPTSLTEFSRELVRLNAANSTYRAINKQIERLQHRIQNLESQLKPE